jgi:hypothetical protein
MEQSERKKKVQVMRPRSGKEKIRNSSAEQRKKKKIIKMWSTHIGDENFRMKGTLGDAQTLQELYTQTVSVVVLEV